MKWEAIKFWLLFFRKTWRSPERYRKLFRDISSCYLTPGQPGRATVNGIVTECVTSAPRMVMLLDGAEMYFINRKTLAVQRREDTKDLQLWDRRVSKLKKVFDQMIRRGMPYKMSDTHVTETGL